MKPCSAQRNHLFLLEREASPQRDGRSLERAVSSSKRKRPSSVCSSGKRVVVAKLPFPHTRHVYLPDDPPLHPLALLPAVGPEVGPRRADRQLARVVRVLGDRDRALEAVPCVPLEPVSTRAQASEAEEGGRRDAPTETVMGSLKTSIVCFQCVGVSHAPVVKNTSPSASATLASRWGGERRRGAEVKNVSKCARSACSVMFCGSLGEERGARVMGRTKGEEKERDEMVAVWV